MRAIFEHPDADSAWAEHVRVVEQLMGRFDAAAELLAEAGDKIPAFTAFPRAQCRQLRRNSPLERLTKEIRRRTGVVGIFPIVPGDPAGRCGAGRAHFEWQVARRYMFVDSLTTVTNPTDTDGQEKEPPALPDAA